MILIKYNIEDDKFINNYHLILFIVCFINNILN